MTDPPLFPEPDAAAVQPTDVQRTEPASIRISWSDNTQTTWTAGELRGACPCATCREKKRGEQSAGASTKSGMMGLPVLSAAEAKPLTIETMRPVGNYAYNVIFSDGHHSGIYTFDVLRK